MTDHSPNPQLRVWLDDDHTSHVVGRLAVDPAMIAHGSNQFRIAVQPSNPWNEAPDLTALRYNDTAPIQRPAGLDTMDFQVRWSSLYRRPGYSFIPPELAIRRQQADSLWRLPEFRDEWGLIRSIDTRNDLDELRQTLARIEKQILDRPVTVVGLFSSLSGWTESLGAQLERLLAGLRNAERQLQVAAMWMPDRLASANAVLPPPADIVEKIKDIIDEFSCDEMSDRRFA